jgi:hypothetical protein
MTFSMIARYADNKNYAVCEFNSQTAGKLRIFLRQYQNGKIITLAKGDILNYNQRGGSNIVAAIQVHGNQAVCAFNNQTISTLFAQDTLATPPLQGQVGFAAWDPTPGNSEIIVKNVGVSSDIYELGTNIQLQ